MPHHTYPLDIVPDVTYEQISAVTAADGCRPSSAIRLPAGAADGVTNPSGLGYGDGPIYLIKTGPDGLRASETLLVLVAPSYENAYMLRGVGLDVASDVLFAKFPYLIYASGTAPADGAYQLWLIAASPPPVLRSGWRRESLVLYVPEPGCYAIQIDGTAIRYQIVFSVAS